MQFNNGNNPNTKKQNNSFFTPQNPQTNFLQANRQESSSSVQNNNTLLLNKRYRNDEHLDLYKSDSTFLKPVDNYVMPTQSSHNFDTPTTNAENNPKTEYYNPNNNKGEVESSVNETSLVDGGNPLETPGGIKTPNQDTEKPKLQNIVSTVNLKCKLDLREIALKARNAEYNPKRFAAVIMRIREPKTTALIFASGKMVCTGARSEEDSKKAARNYAKIIQKLGNEVRFTEFTIQNIVGSCDVKFPIRLEGLAASDNSKFCSYEPEMFPGLIYRMHNPKIVLLIFVSGKIVLTGAKNRDDIYNAFNIILPILRCYKKNPTNQ